MVVYFFIQISDTEPPYGVCENDVITVAECLKLCNTIRAEQSCQCRDIMERQSISSRDLPDCNILGQLCLLKEHGMFIWLSLI